MRTAPWTHALKSHGQRLAALLVPQPSAGVVRAFHRQSPAPGHTHPPAGDTGPEHLAQSGQKKGYSFLQLTYTSLKSCKERMSQDDKFPLGRCENGGSERESVSQTPLPGSYGRAGMKIDHGSQCQTLLALWSLSLCRTRDGRQMQELEVLG